MKKQDGEIDRATARFAATWATFSGDTPNADLSEDGLLIRRWADNLFPFWNIAIVPSAASTAASLHASLTAAVDYARLKRQPGSVWVADDRMALLGSDRANALADMGLAEGGVMTEMVGSVSAMALRKTDLLAFERVSDDHALHTLADVNGQAYDLPAATVRAGIATAPGTWMKAAYSYLGYEDGEPVSVASVLPHDGCLYLGLVATRPGAQHRGLAAATVSHALREAHRATGIDCTDLHATEAGAPVYPQIGFRPTVAFRSLRLAVQ